LSYYLGPFGKYFDRFRDLGQTLKGIVKRTLSLRPSTKDLLFENVIYNGKWSEIIDGIRAGKQVGSLLKVIFPSEEDLEAKVHFVQKFSVAFKKGVMVKCPAGHAIGHPFVCYLKCLTDPIRKAHFPTKHALVDLRSLLRRLRVASEVCDKGDPLSPKQLIDTPNELDSWRNVCQSSPTT